VRIVFASLPAYGHLYPMVPLAVACAEAGHEVTVAVAEPFLDALPVPTTRGMAEGVTLHDIEQETFRDHPGIQPGIEFAAYMFGVTNVRYTVPALTELFERQRPDLVVYEAMDVGAPVVAARFGVRAIAFALGLWNGPLTRFHEMAGTPPDLPGGYLDTVPASLQNPVPLPAKIMPIRPVSWAPPVPLPVELTDSARPRVYVTLGTVAFGAVEVLRRAVVETAAHAVDVLVAVGPAGDPTLLGELPPNVRLERFVPQADVLRHVDLVVHHGGAGTMLGALAAGLPQLILPQGADQPFNATAIERAGAGRALANDAQTPGAIETAVAALLTDGPERLAAKRIAAEIAAMPSPASVAELLQP
jgi:UDP:flavonoid glycosyltransferase YjiC (YdhE family)